MKNFNDSLKPETLRLTEAVGSVFDTEDWRIALAINEVICSMAPGLSGKSADDLDPVKIRAFPPVRNLRPTLGYGGKFITAEEHRRRCRVVDNFYLAKTSRVN